MGLRTPYLNYIDESIERTFGNAKNLRMLELGDQMINDRAMSYCQIWCMPRKSSGDLVGLFDLFSVNKCHAFNDLCQVFEAA